ncbi:hypothetical protein ACN42_g7660 [Penicillium freii]|uniref:Uncharacterized protein n=1 Tax=Penicillium freii TaxID=48697 RepID=A0A101MFM5_PENFR|nr:hypothetical protein ACN42_g7660 [Penicillium freii]
MGLHTWSEGDEGRTRKRCEVESCPDELRRWWGVTEIPNCSHQVSWASITRENSSSSSSEYIKIIINLIPNEIEYSANSGRAPATC